jgi:hypothetical protein
MAEHILMLALDVTASDLEANRAGKLSEKQRRLLAKSGKELFWGLTIIGFFIGLLLFYVRIQKFSVQSGVWLMLVGWLCFTLIGLAILIFNKWVGRSAKVYQAEGLISFYTWGRHGQHRVLVVGQAEFPLALEIGKKSWFEFRELFKAHSQQRFRVYYAKPGNIPLSLEAVSS